MVDFDIQAYLREMREENQAGRQAIHASIGVAMDKLNEHLVNDATIHGEQNGRLNAIDEDHRRIGKILWAGGAATIGLLANALKGHLGLR